MATTEFLKITLPGGTMDSITLVNVFNDLVDKFNTHDHTLDKGVSLESTAVNITTRVNFNDSKVDNIKFLNLYPNNNIDGVFNSIYIKNNSMYFKTADGQVIQLTKDGKFNSALAGGIGGDYGESGGNVVYTLEDNTYSFYLNNDLSQIHIKNLVVNGTLTLKKEAGGANYTLILPDELPTVSSILTVDEEGSIKYYHSNTIGFLTGVGGTTVASIPIDLGSLQVDTENILKGVQYNSNGIPSASVNSAVIVPSTFLDSLPNGAIYYDSTDKNFGYKVNGLWRYTADVEHSLLKLDSISDVSLASTMTTEYRPIDPTEDPDDPETELELVIIWEEKPLEHGDFLGYMDGLWRPMNTFLHSTETLKNFPSDITDITLYSLSDLSDIGELTAITGSAGLLGYYDGALGLELPIADTVDWAVVSDVNIEAQKDLIDLIDGLPDTEDQTEVLNSYIGKVPVDSLNNLVDVIEGGSPRYLLKAEVSADNTGIEYVPYDITGTPSPLYIKGDLWIGGGSAIDVTDTRLPVGDNGKALALVNNEGEINLEWVDPPIIDIAPGWYEAYRFNSTFTTAEYGHYYPEYKDYKIKLKRASLDIIKSEVTLPDFELVISTGGGVVSQPTSGVNFVNQDLMYMPSVTFTCDTPNFYRVSIRRDPLIDDILTTIQPTGQYRLTSDYRNLDKLTFTVYVPLGKGKRWEAFSASILCSENPLDSSGRNEKITYSLKFTQEEYEGKMVYMLKPDAAFYYSPEYDPDNYTLTSLDDNSIPRWGYRVTRKSTGVVEREIYTEVVLTPPSPSSFNIGRPLTNIDLDATLDLSTINCVAMGNGQPSYSRSIGATDEGMIVDNLSSLSPIDISATSFDIPDLSNPLSIIDPTLMCDLNVALASIEVPYSMATIDDDTLIYISKLRYNSSDYRAGFKFYNISITHSDNSYHATRTGTFIISTTSYNTGLPEGAEPANILLEGYDYIHDMIMNFAGTHVLITGNVNRVYRLTAPFDISSIYLNNDGSEFAYKQLIEWGTEHPFAGCRLHDTLGFSPDGRSVVMFRDSLIKIYTCSTPFDTDDMALKSESTYAAFLGDLSVNLSNEDLDLDVYYAPPSSSIGRMNISNDGVYIGMTSNNATLRYLSEIDPSTYGRRDVSFTGAVYVQLNSPYDLSIPKINQHLTLMSTTGAAVNNEGIYRANYVGTAPRSTGLRAAMSHISSGFSNTLHRFSYVNQYGEDVDNPRLLIYKISPHNNRVVCKHYNMDFTLIPYINGGSNNQIYFYPVKLDTILRATAATTQTWRVGNTLLWMDSSQLISAYFKMPEDILSVGRIALRVGSDTTIYPIYGDIIVNASPEGYEPASTDPYTYIKVDGYNAGASRPLFSSDGYRHSMTIWYKSIDGSEYYTEFATMWLSSPFTPSSAYKMVLSELRVRDMREVFFSEDGLYGGLRSYIHASYSSKDVIYHCTLSTPFLPSSCTGYWVEDLQTRSGRNKTFLDGVFLNDGMYFLTIGRALTGTYAFPYLVPPLLVERDSLDHYVTLFKLKRSYRLDATSQGWNIYKGEVTGTLAGSFFSTGDVYVSEQNLHDLRVINLHNGLAIPVPLTSPPLTGTIPGFLKISSQALKLEDILYLTIEGEQNTIDEEV